MGTLRYAHGRWLSGAPLSFTLSGPQSQHVVLSEALVYESPSGWIFEAPVGSVVDLASVPRIVRPLMPSWHKSAQAGTGHDLAYRWGPEVFGLTRRQADAQFWHMLRLDGVNRVHAWLMWAGVRVGGWAAWRKWRACDEGLKGIRPPKRQMA